MNFHLVNKVCSPLVIEMLKVILGNKGTVAFLQVMSNVLSSYLDKSITLEDRICRIWHSLYFLRIWRCSILKDKSSSLKNNFITTNAYSCIELNAHALIQLIKYFNSNDSLHLHMFIPWYFSTLVCEELFRTARSMTSTYSTIINFSIKDILRRLTRIQFLNIIQNDLHDNQKNTTNKLINYTTNHSR